MSPQRNFMRVLNKLCKSGGSAWKPHLYNRLVTALPRAKMATVASKVAAATSPAGKKLAINAAKPVHSYPPP